MWVWYQLKFAIFFNFYSHEPISHNFTFKVYENLVRTLYCIQWSRARGSSRMAVGMSKNPWGKSSIVVVINPPPPWLRLTDVPKSGEGWGVVQRPFLSSSWCNHGPNSIYSMNTKATSPEMDGPLTPISWLLTNYSAAPRPGSTVNGFV